MTQINLIKTLSRAHLCELLSLHHTITGVLSVLIGAHPSSAVRSALKDRISELDISYDEYKTNKRVSYNASQLIDAIAHATCWSDIYRQLGLTICGFNKQSVITQCTRWNISIPTFADLSTAYRRGKPQWEAADIFKADSTYSRGSLRRAYQLIHPATVCSVCNIVPTWNNLPLTLELDHINGISTDNRLENLRWICPNCHSQTCTYKGRNTKLKRNYLCELKHSVV